MNVLAVISPGLKVLFERVGKPEVTIGRTFFGSAGRGRSSPAITLAGPKAYGWPTPFTQDSCATCQSKSFSVRRYHDGCWSTVVPFRLTAWNHRQVRSRLLSIFFSMVE